MWYLILFFCLNSSNKGISPKFNVIVLAIMLSRIFRAISKTYKLIFFLIGLFLICISNFSRKDYLTVVKVDNTVETMNQISSNPMEYPWYVSESGRNWIGYEEAYFFSAYYDFRENATVVLSILEREFKDISCTLWYEKDEYSETVKPIITIIPDSHRPKYTEAVLKCPNSQPKLPTVVSLRNITNNRIFASLNIQLKRESPKTEIHWCLSPIHSSKRVQFLEAIVLHKLIGVHRATFYSANPNISETTKKFDWIQTVDWALPVKQEEIQYHGQRAALNDCLYRNMFTARYIVFADLDEIFLPRRLNLTASYSDTLWQELNLLQGANKNKISAFYGKSVLFGTPRSLKGFASIWVTKRYVQPQESRRKYIVLPERVSHVNVHWVFPYQKFWNMYLPHNLVMLHHYRRCPNPKKKCCGRDITRNPMTEDTFTHNLKNEIIKLNTTLSETIFS